MTNWEYYNDAFLGVGDSPVPLKACHSCRYFKATYDTKGYEEYVGTCRRFPPLNAPHLTEAMANNAAHHYDDLDQLDNAFDTADSPQAYRFPQVFESDWCGEWKPKD